MKMKGSGEKGVGEIMEELFKKHLFKKRKQNYFKLRIFEIFPFSAN